MAKPLGKKVDIEKIAELYISRLKGEPDAMRLLMNMLADNLTHVDKLKELIIRHEYSISISKPRANETVIIRELSEVYGMSKSKIQEILKQE